MATRIQRRTKRSYSQDNFQTITGTIDNIGSEWKKTYLATSPLQGKIVRVKIVASDTSNDYLDLKILDSPTISEVSTVLFYKNVPILGTGLDSGEEIPYSGSKLYLAAKFYAGEGNSLQYKIDIQTQGTLSKLVVPISYYRVVPAYPDELPPPAVLTGFRKLYNLSDQLAGQLDGETVDLILSPAAIEPTIMVVIDGQVMTHPQVLGVDPNKSGDYEILSENHVRLHFVPDSESTIVLMYIEK